MAYSVVRNFIRPVAISTRLENEKVDCGLATFIVVNRDGWIVTAAHVFGAMQASQVHAQERAAYHQRVAAINADQTLTGKQRHRQLDTLKQNPNWITHQSLWWYQNGVTATNIQVDPLADVAIARLVNFDTASIPTFPVFKLPNTDPPLGGSLCRMGFAFAEVAATFNQATGNFEMQSQVQAPIFPNDGIHTRIALALDQPTGRTAKFIETSTPGLRGQSGGPLFDVRGEVWGIQSRTNFLELGFSPKKKDGGKEITEHQFLNVGLAAHVQHAIDLFNAHGVQYTSV